MKKIIKWTGLAVALLVLISLVSYTGKRKKPSVSGDDLLKEALVEIRVHKNYPKAIALLKQTLAIDSSYTEAKVTLGHAYLLFGNLDSAQKYLQMTLRNDRTNGNALLYIINVNMQQRDTAAVLRNINLYLEHYPSDSSMWLKKYVLLLERGEYAGAERVSEYLASQGLAKEVASINQDYWMAAATAKRKAGNIRGAYEGYKKALLYDPHGEELLQQLVNLSVYLGDYASAMTYNNTLLELDRSNTVYLINASLINARLNNNEQAELYAQEAYRLNPNNLAAKRNFIDINLSFAQIARGADRLQYANTVLQMVPHQREAMLYAINSHIVMRESGEALEVTNEALKYYPSDPIFINKKLGILHDMKSYGLTANYLDVLLSRHQTKTYIDAYEEVWLQIAVSLIRERSWDEALAAVEKGLVFHSRNPAFLEQQVNIYGSMGKTADALATTDRLIAGDSKNAGYRFKKAGLLEQQHRFYEAAEITYLLLKEFPEKTAYRVAYQNELESAMRQKMQQMDWGKAIDIYNRSLAAGSPGYYTLMYGIGAYSAQQDYSRALSATGTALGFYPDDSAFLIKRSLAFMNLGRYSEGLAVSREVMQAFPADNSLKSLYVDELHNAGKYYEKNNSIDIATGLFIAAHNLMPADTFALQNLSAIYFLKKQYDSSIYYADLGLKNDSTNAFLLLKKASSYEALKNYKLAYGSASKLLKFQYSKSLSNYADYLRNKASNNQIGISHLQSIFPGSDQYAAITGVDYTYKHSRGSITGKVKFGQRPTGVGVQAGVDAFYIHNKYYYSNAYLYGAAGSAFPFWQGGYSIYRTFKKTWEAEAGARYLRFDPLSNTTAVASLGKYVDNTWINLRGYYTYANKSWYPSCLLSARQYFNDINDYVSAMIGFGRIPDDHNQIYNFNQYAAYESKNVGIGFQKSLPYATMLNMNLNYTQLKLNERKTLNEYDIYLRLSKNF